MIFGPRPGDVVRLHYATKPRRHAAPAPAELMVFHGWEGVVMYVATHRKRGVPRNVGVLLDAADRGAPGVVVVPAGNLRMVRRATVRQSRPETGAREGTSGGYGNPVNVTTDGGLGLARFDAAGQPLAFPRTTSFSGGREGGEKAAGATFARRSCSPTDGRGRSSGCSSA